MNTGPKYRYRYTGLMSYGVHERLHYVDRLGKLERIKAYRYKVNVKGVEITRDALMIYGSKGTIHFTGCTWGYHGEGPTATYAVLLRCSVPQQLAQMYAFRSCCGDKIGVDWEIHMDTVYQMMAVMANIVNIARIDAKMEERQRQYATVN